MYNRPQISEYYLLGLKRLQKIKDFDILVCCSDAQSIDLCEKYDIDWFYYENTPLGLKHNVLFRTALENYSFDYLIHSGDDDVLSDKGFKELISLMEKGERYIVNTKLYFYSTQSKKGLKLDTPITMGAFRVFSRDILEDYGYSTTVHFKKPIQIGGKTYTEGEYILPKKIADYYLSLNACAYVDTNMSLYADNISKGLDFSSHSKLVECGVNPCYTDFCEIVDIKSKQNITSFHKLWGKSKDVSANDIFSIMGEKEIDLLQIL